MYNLGQTFRKIRNTKGLTLDEVANGEFSLSMLSKFENGKTQISVEKLNKALSNMHVSIEEFYYIARELEYDEYTKFISEIDILYYNKDRVALKSRYDAELKLSETNKYGRFNILNSIIIASKIKFLDKSFEIEEEHIKVLYDYLFGIEAWGEYEMTLLINAVDFMSAKIYLLYAKEMLKKAEYFKYIGNVMNLIQISLIHGVSISIDQDYEEGAKYFIEKAKEYIKGGRDVHMIIVYIFTEGYYLTYKGNIEAGKNKVNEAINIFRRVGDIKSAEYYENEYKKYLEELN